MIVAYLLFLIPLNSGATILNTVWFALVLFVFYTFYTLTMLTYYATFAEIAETQQDIVLLSNVKSICDVVYFSLGFALVPAFVSMGMNVRKVALIFFIYHISAIVKQYQLNGG
jgi:Na+/melibiose symporter-like transporter